MKPNIFGLSTVVIAILLSAFTTKVYHIRYYVTNESWDSYSITSNESDGQCQDGDKLCSFVYTGTVSLSSPLSISAYNTLRVQGNIEDESFFRR